jgi:hypothetical protein
MKKSQEGRTRLTTNQSDRVSSFHYKQKHQSSYLTKK